MKGNDRRALAALQVRLQAILPEEYQDSYEDLQPVSMGSAGLKYDGDGKVAWNEMWATFCDLAMAGGPPHKGAYLEPGAAAEIDAQPERYGQVTEEICRGVMMVTDLPADPSPTPGWIRVECLTEAMAQWLLRAIVMENVAARADGLWLDLPAAPHFRLEKEIKNVVTVIAKACHYWLGHMPRLQQRAIAGLFKTMAEESALIAPALRGGDDSDESLATASSDLAERVHQQSGFHPSPLRYAGWVGVECPSVRAAIWMMRGLVVSNVLSRREGTSLFVPVNPATDPGGDIVVRAVTRMRGLAVARGVL